ncbi:MAG: hypothetical protein JRJ45_00595 [Deltaproteobacteria bacterium]|nr:hypothetical protein [Deltaproteobacteria bacterium]
MKMYWAFLMIIFLGLSGLAAGEGGKKGNPNLIIGEDGCVYALPTSTKACEEVPAPPQSGIEVYVCSDVIALCPEEVEEPKS